MIPMKQQQGKHLVPMNKQEMEKNLIPMTHEMGLILLVLFLCVDLHIHIFAQRRVCDWGCKTTGFLLCDGAVDVTAT